MPRDLTNAIKELIMEPKFTVAEEAARKRYIGLFRNFHGMSVAVEKAIADIKAKKLFRPYKNLQQFLMEECGWKSSRRARQVINFIEMKAALPPKVEPLVPTERVARELLKVPEGQRAKVLEEASEIHGKDGEITAKDIKQAVTVTLEVCLDEVGKVVPKTARKYWDRRDEAKEVMSAIRAAKRAVNALDVTDLMWKEVSLQGVLADLSAAISRFSSAIPAYVCPYCAGTGVQHIEVGECRCCTGRGVISKFMWDHAVPMEMKK